MDIKNSLQNLGFSESFIKLNLNEKFENLSSPSKYNIKNSFNKNSLKKSKYVNNYQRNIIKNVMSNQSLLSNKSLLPLIIKDEIRKVYSENNIERLDIINLNLNKKAKEYEELYDCEYLNSKNDFNFPTIYNNNYNSNLIINKNTNLSEILDSKIPAASPICCFNSNNNSFKCKKTASCGNLLNNSDKTTGNLSFYEEENSSSSLEKRRNIISSEDIEALRKIVNNLNKDLNENKYSIKAYNSKLKQKNLSVYINNSKLTEKANELKKYHQCNFPDCRRTFSSAGWLKSHLDEHMIEIQENDYNREFNFYSSFKEKVL